ncbi:hypothetical protein AVEN_215125-1 [Araneus ventricosus]|uniref:Uncharacterized protein n=1 Tax=Araneus ventricosus TaxID=182803 RepID=A0A4Y2JDB6_ARAVE|nr:hypothetical protein AVEN_215125-1 [Araneus ventricosus]
MYEQCPAHKKSSNHTKAYELRLEFSKSIRLGRTVNSKNQKETKMKNGHWREVFKLLEYVDVFCDVEMIVRTRQAMIERRSDKGIQQILVAAHDLCNSIETESEFQELEVRPQKKKKQYGYESLDEAPPKEIQA